VEGQFVIAYDTDTNDKLDSLVWNIKMILQSGQVDLDDDAIAVSVIVATKNETSLNFTAALNNETGFWDNNITGGSYGVKFLNIVRDDEILDPGEICRFFVKLDASIEIEANEMVIIMIFSGAAMLKVFKTAPTGINPGLNILR
jgi:hypothetical protein